MKSTIGHGLVVSSALALTGLLYVALWALHQIHVPYPLMSEPFPEAPVVEFAPATGLREIARILGERDIVSNPVLFMVYVRVIGAGTSLRAGEYAFERNSSMRDIAQVLRQGRVVLHSITVPEGLVSSEVAAIVLGDDRLSGPLAEMPADGLLLPETYFFARGEQRQALVERMRDDMYSLLQDLWVERDEGLPLDSMLEALVLASIVEEETAVPEERPHVASVFLNRLVRGMLLQSDPTVKYALAIDNVRSVDSAAPLTVADLEYDSAYNTYRYAGLPPGPVSAPGRASIEAVLHPLLSNDLYFVADGTGGHAFAETLEEHNRNVRRWRELNRLRP